MTEPEFIEARARFDAACRNAFRCARGYSPGACRKYIGAAVDVLHEVLCRSYADNSHLFTFTDPRGRKLHSRQAKTND